MNLKEALKQSGSITFLNGGNIKEAEKRIQKDETLLYALITCISSVLVNGQLNTNFTLKNKDSGVFVITNKRIFFAQSILGSSKFKEIQLENIQSIDSAKNIDAKIRICGITEMFVLDVKRKQVNEIECILNQAITNLKSYEGNDNTKSLSNYDQLKQLKNLLDDGIITQEEFDAKKKQLLGL